jgi:hypothetical protein
MRNCPILSTGRNLGKEPGNLGSEEPLLDLFELSFSRSCSGPVRSRIAIWGPREHTCWLAEHPAGLQNTALQTPIAELWLRSGCWEASSLCCAC